MLPPPLQSRPLPRRRSNTLGLRRNGTLGRADRHRLHRGHGGDGAPCLTAPDWGAETLTVLGEGEAVEVRAETMGEWQPVNCAGAGGYVHAALIAWTPVGLVGPGSSRRRAARSARPAAAGRQ